MNTSHTQRGAIRKACYAAAKGMLSLALAMTMVPASAFAATDSWGGVQR